MGKSAKALNARWGSHLTGQPLNHHHRLDDGTNRHNDELGAKAPQVHFKKVCSIRKDRDRDMNSQYCRQFSFNYLQ
jgi:hypothetical protein